MKLRIALLVLIGFTLSFFQISAQSYDWSMSVGSTTGPSGGRAIATDVNGNVFVSGYFSGTADFNPFSAGPTTTSLGQEDMFIAKYDVNGTFDRVRWGGNTLGNDQAYDMILDNAGNVYITGTFTGTAAFFPFSSPITSAGGTDIFLLKYDNNLIFQWVIGIGSVNDDGGYGLAVDNLNNVYVTGSFQGAGINFDPRGGVVPGISSNGGEDVFIAKYDGATGNCLGVLGIGGLGNERAWDIDHDGNANLYLTGYFENVVEFNPGVAASSITSVGATDAFVASYSSALAYSWARGIGSTGNEQGQKIKVGNFGNIYTTGFFQGAGVAFGSGINLTSAGSDDIYLTKLSNLGVTLWSHGFGGAGSDKGLSMDLDGCSNVYLGGYFTGQLILILLQQLLQLRALPSQTMRISWLNMMRLVRTNGRVGEHQMA